MDQSQTGTIRWKRKHLLGLEDLTLEEITEILDRWLDPTHRYFRVRTRDGGMHLLRHDGDSGRWEVRGVTEPER